MDGVLLCDKPAGPTSHDIVYAARRAVRAAAEGRRTRVGHAGTLDPFATGLLLVLVGRATRIQRFLMELPKTYEVVARFGATSTTGDPDGELTETGVVPDGDLAAAHRGAAPAAADLLGDPRRRAPRLRARPRGGGPRRCPSAP